MGKAKDTAPTIPSFLTPQTHEEEIGGRALTFHAMSAVVLFRLHAIASPIAKAFDAFVSKDMPAAERQRAYADALDALGANGELAAMLVLDALHDEEWVVRPVTLPAARDFYATVDGTTLVAMLAAVFRVNAAAFAPLLKGLLAGGASAAQAEASSPEPETSDAT